MCVGRDCTDVVAEPSARFPAGRPAAGQLSTGACPAVDGAGDRCRAGWALPPDLPWGQAGRCFQNKACLYSPLQCFMGHIQVPAQGGCLRPGPRFDGVSGTQSSEGISSTPFPSQHVRGSTCILITSALNKEAKSLSKTKANKSCGW